MRAISKVLKGVASLAALVAVMAVPATAIADVYWTEYDDQPLGGSPTSEAPVTADFTGTIAMMTSAPYGTMECEVAGTIGFANDWDNPSGSAATNQILSLAPAESVAESCSGSSFGCGISSVSFSGFPWAGVTDENWNTEFDGFSVTYYYLAGGGCYYLPFIFSDGDWTGLTAIMDTTPSNGEADCVVGFDFPDGDVDHAGGNFMHAPIEGQLDLDLDTVEGLTTEDGGPCVALHYW